MGILELLILAVGLSMDAFAVSVCKGLSVSGVKFRHMAAAGLWFGGFQAAMPLAGYLLGVSFAEAVSRYANILAFLLLVFIGANMVKESLGDDADDDADRADMSPKAMLPLAIATSIDALAVGVTFAFLEVSVLPAVSIIGVVTFLFSAVGVKIGSIFGARYKSRAELCGGVILILLAFKILLF